MAPSRVVITGIKVCSGRFLAPSAFGDRGFNEKLVPRSWNRMPLCGSTSPEPNAWYTLWIRDTAKPSPSAAAMPTVSPRGTRTACAVSASGAAARGLSYTSAGTSTAAMRGSARSVERKRLP